MGVHQQPDPAKEVAGLGGAIHELARTTRRGKPAPNLRDFKDTAPLSKAQDGHVPVYDSATGTWRPRSMSGGGSPLTARVELALTGTADNTETQATTWTVGEDNIGLTINGVTGNIAVPSAGTVIATAWAGWAANADGSRILRLNGYWTNSYDERMAVTVAGRVTRQTGAIIEHYETSQIAEAFNVAVGHYGVGGTLDVTVSLSVAFWPDA